MQTWDFDSVDLPTVSEDVHPIPAKYAEQLVEALRNQEFTTVRIARVYDRKGHVSMDGLGRPRNKGYGSDNDAFLVQLSLVMDADQDEWPVQAMNEVDKSMKKDELLAKRAEIERRRDEVKRQREALDTEMAELDRQLNETEV
jgi:hypothetical protein